MRTRTYIPILLLSMLLLFVTISSNVYSQDPLPAEKKRTLSKFDPAGVFPQSNGGRDNGRRKPGSADPVANKDSNLTATSPESASQRKNGRKKSSTGGTVDTSDQLQSSIGPMPSTAVLPAVSRVIAPSPTSTPLPLITPPLPAPTSASTPAPEATPTPDPAQTPLVASVAQPSDPGAAAPLSTAIPNQPVPDSGFSLLFIVGIMSLILLALIVVVIKLKKQLSAP